MTFRKYSMIHTFIFLLVLMLSIRPWPYAMLTAAQLLYIPLTLYLVLKNDDWFSKYYFYVATPAYIAITILQATDHTSFDGLLAGIYFLFTIIVATYGIYRFLQHGFAHIEEFSINMGLIYLALGGAWFFAYETYFDTGFSPLITWLTSIHFHYSAFLLPIFVGFLGRLYKPTYYKFICTIVLISPMSVAIGITFSRWLELIAVILYIIGIYGLLYLSFKTVFLTNWQKKFVMISFAGLGVTIIFSLLYALGNAIGLFIVSIDFMLRFHGVLNCIVFALIGLIGWSFAVPSPPKRASFPISFIRGKRVIGESILQDTVNVDATTDGLVERMNSYEPQIDTATLSPAIIDFYEHTTKYRLFAEIRWRPWFKPLAMIYRLISRYTKQINLPLSNKRVEMTGAIYPIKDELDGRIQPRIWMRKIHHEVAFVAIYSEHQTNGKTYMNIALPLPWSSMIGILELNQIGQSLQLTSKKQNGQESDAGIFLAFGPFLPKLPLEEVFHVEEMKSGHLQAQHTMWICGIPFLAIDYQIRKRS